MVRGSCKRASVKRRAKPKARTLCQLRKGVGMGAPSWPSPVILPKPAIGFFARRRRTGHRIRRFRPGRGKRETRLALPPRQPQEEEASG